MTTLEVGWERVEWHRGAPQGAGPPGPDIARARERRAALQVDLGAIRRNFRAIHALAHGARVMAVVKGDAYGLGALAVSRVLQSCRAEAFAVDSVAEGIELRESGVDRSIFVIDGDIPENAPLAVEYGMIPGVANEDLLLAYERAAAAARRTHRLWLVANVGFNRSGYRTAERFSRFVDAALQCRHLEVSGVYAHLTDSNGSAELSRAQIGEFQALAEAARSRAGRRLETSLFASHGLLRWADEFPTDWVRPGLLLYGEHAFVESRVERSALERFDRFTPAVTLKSRITQILEFERAEGVGYGQQCATRSGQRLATLAIGFGGGYPSGNSQGYAIVAGRRVPLFGPVGMDALQIDVTDVPDARLYQEVILIGRDGDEDLTAGSVARNAGTSPYALLRGLKCERTYIDREYAATIDGRLDDQTDDTSPEGGQWRQ